VFAATYAFKLEIEIRRAPAIRVDVIDRSAMSRWIVHRLTLSDSHASSMLQ
jgi:hypothetical protein